MDQEKFGNLIKDIRKKNNLTQKDIADKYNVTYQAVSKWENGKNMPDISLIREICKDYDISLDEIFETKSKKKSIIIYIILSICIVILLIFLVIHFTSHEDFVFKTIASNCNNFNISGSISYNDKKSAIYISNVEYCGGDDIVLYKEITCALYETNNNTEVIIDKCKKEKNMTLESYLKNISFTIDNYSKVCKKYSENSFFLEINAIDEKEKTTTYKVPLVLKSNC